MAETVAAALNVLAHVRVPVQPLPSQPVNVDAALVGVAVSVTAVPVPNDALHVAPQLMPAGDDVTVPLPDPLLTTVSATGKDAVTHCENSSRKKLYGSDTLLVSLLCAQLLLMRVKPSRDETTFGHRCAST